MGVCEEIEGVHLNKLSLEGEDILVKKMVVNTHTHQLMLMEGPYMYSESLFHVITKCHFPITKANSSINKTVVPVSFNFASFVKKYM